MGMQHGTVALRDLWASWRRGESVACPCGGALGLRVRATPLDDEAGALYCLHCVACGDALPWFEARQDDVRTIRDAPTQRRLPVAPKVEGTRSGRVRADLADHLANAFGGDAWVTLRARFFPGMRG